MVSQRAVTGSGSISYYVEVTTAGFAALLARAVKLRLNAGLASSSHVRVELATI